MMKNKMSFKEKFDFLGEVFVGVLVAIILIIFIIIFGSIAYYGLSISFERHREMSHEYVTDKCPNCGEQVYKEVIK